MKSSHPDPSQVDQGQPSPDVITCPNCNTDISNTYEPNDYALGIPGGWYCYACEVKVREATRKRKSKSIPPSPATIQKMVDALRRARYYIENLLPNSARQSAQTVFDQIDAALDSYRREVGG